MSAEANILVVDDEAPQRMALSEFLRSEGYTVDVAEGGPQALKKLNEAGNHYDIVVTDLAMPDLDGIQLLDRVKAQSKDTEVLLVTGHGSVETAVRAMKKGAYDYLLKPLEYDEVSLLISRTLEGRDLRNRTETLLRENARLRGDAFLQSKAPKMKALLEELRQVIDSDSTVLLAGETGVGKEVIARYIHDSSVRSSRSFVAVNCGAIPENLIESELFGHEKGSFTGAEERHTGNFERANRGTIFLDEIGELSLEHQPKILRALENRTIQRIGGVREIPIDVRIISATHRNLEGWVREGRFREDLMYRLNVVKFEIPPLRERMEDLPELSAHLINRVSKRVNKKVSEVQPGFIEKLMGYRFPGNVRELANLIERALIYMKGSVLRAEDLSLGSGSSGASVPGGSSSIEGVDLDFTSERKLSTYVDEFEKSVISQALSYTNGDVDQTAKLLKTSRSTLYSKISKHHLKA